MKIIYLFLTLFTLVSSSLTAQTVRYVKPNGTGNGTSWANASGDLRSTLANATSGIQVWVAAGTYYPVSCSNCTVADREQRFEINNGVAVYGGFEGNETSLTERDWQNNTTYLHGDINHDNTLTDNSYNILFTHNVSDSTLLDGFIITMGYADNSQASLGSHYNSGAAWFNDGQLPGSQSHPVIRNCSFINNHSVGYAGALYNDGGFQGAASPLVENCLFSNNSCLNSGGAVANIGEFSGISSPVFNDCSFINNLASQNGGAVFNMGAEIGTNHTIFNNCNFDNNITTDKGGGIYNFGKNGDCIPAFYDCTFNGNDATSGGSIYNDGTFGGQCNMIAEDCLFEYNSTTSDGGALYNAAFEGEASPQISRCTFRFNHSGGAGTALFNNGDSGFSEPEITDCLFYANTADTYGGAMYNQGKSGHSSPVITNCLFYNNSASSAGAIYNLGAEGGHADAIITNCTFYGNNANVGGAIYCNASDNGNSTPVITNCIFKSNNANFGSVFRCIEGTPFIQYSLVDVLDCNSLNSGAGSNVSCGDGMLYDADPMFGAPAAGDFHPSPVSPVVDAGYNAMVYVSLDLEGHPRISNSVVDLGVYEYIDQPDLPQIVSQPQAATLCENGSFTLQVGVTATTDIQYQWFHNGEPVEGAIEAVLIVNPATESDAGDYYCSISNVTGTVFSNTVEITVYAYVNPVISVLASSESVCTGDEVIFTAAIENGGDLPAYQWFKNNIEVGNNDPVYVDETLVSSDIITCWLTSTAACVITPSIVSDPVSVLVSEQVTPAVSIENTTAVFCEGTEVMLTAATVNGGPAPGLQWYVNDVVAGTGQSLVSSELETGDVIYCILTSSLACATTSTAESLPFTLQTTPTLAPFIQIIASDTSICIGDYVTFTVEIVNGGENPALEWFINGISTGITGDIFTTNALWDGDLVGCYLTSSLPCVTAEVVNSPSIQMEVCVATQEMEAVDIEFYPNPFSDFLTVSLALGSIPGRLIMYNATGNMVFEKNINPGKTIIPLEALPSGIYTLAFSGEKNLRRVIVKVN